MSHAMPRLNVYGRVLIVRRVLEEDWAPAAAAESLGISRATAYKWLRRFRDEGPAGRSLGGSSVFACLSYRPLTMERDLP